MFKAMGQRLRRMGRAIAQWNSPVREINDRSATIARRRQRLASIFPKVWRAIQAQWTRTKYAGLMCINRMTVVDSLHAILNVKPTQNATVSLLSCKSMIYVNFTALIGRRGSDFRLYINDVMKHRGNVSAILRDADPAVLRALAEGLLGQDVGVSFLAIEPYELAIAISEAYPLAHYLSLIKRILKAEGFTLTVPPDVFDEI